MKGYYFRLSRSLILVVLLISSTRADQEPQDSPLERVHVKQETGFDGKVRAIRFGLDETARFHPRSAEETQTSSRRRRDLDNRIDEEEELEGAEAKVFRPLFVYRQQVARRLKLRDDKRRSVKQQPSVYYYYPYYYPAYNTYYRY